MKKKYHINILEQELSVLSDSGDDHVSSVIQFVKDKMEQIRLVSSNITTLNVAILAALNIADEYLTYTSSNETIYNQLERRAENLICLIEKRI